MSTSERTGCSRRTRCGAPPSGRHERERRVRDAAVALARLGLALSSSHGISLLQPPAGHSASSLPHAVRAPVLSAYKRRKRRFESRLWWPYGAVGWPPFGRGSTDKTWGDCLVASGRPACRPIRKKWRVSVDRPIVSRDDVSRPSRGRSPRRLNAGSPCRCPTWSSRGSTRFTVPSRRSRELARKERVGSPR
jgi:hypothetical protein